MCIRDREDEDGFCSSLAAESSFLFFIDAAKEGFLNFLFFGNGGSFCAYCFGLMNADESVFCDQRKVADASPGTCGLSVGQFSPPLLSVMAFLFKSCHDYALAPIFSCSP